MQNPEAHSPSRLQTAPRGFSPQLPFTHRTLLTQSASERQVGKQPFVAVSQLNGAQTVEGPGLQLPRPSQTWTPVTAAPSQRPGLQTVPAGCWRQAPLPSHMPSSPQVAVSVGWQEAATGGACPSGTTAQVPSDP